MLSRLNIRNLALVDSINIEFSSGLNVITGETGAGKSLLINALRLLLGERADKTMIRTGETSSSIEAIFELANPEKANIILEEHGLPPCENGTLIIRRMLTESSSKNFLNDSPVTLPVMKSLGNVLVDMHGPYDHQSLLKPEAQLDILDAFGQLENERADYHKSYSDFLKIEKELKRLSEVDDSALEEQIDLLSWRIKEVEDGKISEDDEKDVFEEHEKISNAQNILELAQTAVSGLTESEYSSFEGLSSARRACTQMSKYIPEAENWSDELDGALKTVQEISAIILDSVGDIESSNERLQFLDERISLYRRLKRKYGESVSEILKQLKQWQVRLKELKSRDEVRAKIETQRKSALKSTIQKGTLLREKRKEVADILVESITSELKELGFNHGEFQVHLSDCEPCQSGIDSVEFGFAPNAGETMRPLRSIASSGEISRVMLAVKAILARHDHIPLLVFDEIDANVGGEIAIDVGRKLAQVGKTHQIISITHLPQVAVCGKTHFAVSKSIRDGRTFTSIQKLDETSRAEEVARMLGGKDLTNVTLQHANELLKQETFL